MCICIRYHPTTIMRKKYKKERFTVSAHKAHHVLSKSPDRDKRSVIKNKLDIQGHYNIVLSVPGRQRM